MQRERGRGELSLEPMRREGAVTRTAANKTRPERTAQHQLVCLRTSKDPGGMKERCQTRIMASNRFGGIEERLRKGMWQTTRKRRSGLIEDGRLKETMKGDDCQRECANGR
jgi:hypothetical protein